MKAKQGAARKRSHAELVEAARPHIDWLAGLTHGPNGMATAFLAVDAFSEHYTPAQRLAKISKVVDVGKASVGHFLDHLNALEEILRTGKPATPGKVIDLGAWRAEKIAPKGEGA